jgi:murein L,D-transpeptidase YafK
MPSSPGWRPAALIALLLASTPAAAIPKHEAPLPAATLSLLRSAGTTPGAPVLVRIYKKEAELEVWKRSLAGRFVRVKTFPICRWSGQLGPKRREGDRQAPEGFYAVTPGLMNPNSAYYLSFDTGFPNAYDRAHGATGSALMVHGTCSSAGCYAMTDEGIAEIYALMREAFAGGQRAVQVQAYPFRMTAENLVRHRLDPNIAFWRQLKEGSDRFEATGQEPVVLVKGGRYTFQPLPDPQAEAEVAAYRLQEEDHAAALLEEGRPAVRTTYADGGQHPSFAALARKGVNLGDVSRPEALAYAGLEGASRNSNADLSPRQETARTVQDMLSGTTLTEAFTSADLDRRQDQQDAAPAASRASAVAAGRETAGRDLVFPPGYQTRPSCGPYGSCATSFASVRSTACHSAGGKRSTDPIARPCPAAASR